MQQFFHNDKIMISVVMISASNNQCTFNHQTSDLIFEIILITSAGLISKAAIKADTLPHTEQQQNTPCCLNNKKNPKYYTKIPSQH